jgi:hypothetical protein
VGAHARGALLPHRIRGSLRRHEHCIGLLSEDAERIVPQELLELAVDVEGGMLFGRIILLLQGLLTLHNGHLLLGQKVSFSLRLLSFRLLLLLLGVLGGVVVDMVELRLPVES